MNLSIQKKLLLVVATALVLMIALTAVINWQFSRMTANKKAVVLTSQALGDQMSEDIMHDALRGDVLDALNAAATKNDKAATEAAKALAEQPEVFRASVKANHERPLPSTVATALHAVDKPLDDYIKSAESIITIAAKDPISAELQWLAFQEAFSKLESTMGESGDKAQASVKDIAAASKDVVTQFHITVVVALMISAVSLLVISMFITRSIVTGLDRIGKTLSEGSSQLTASAAEVFESSKTLAESASQQAAALEETSASLEEISAMTKRYAESAMSGAKLGDQARGAATVGIEKFSELSHSLACTKTATAEMQTAVKEMQAAIQQVSKIIKTTDEIAFQTNLIALNAAIEAARAGEVGMGFAVLADEVRALAQRSAQAAKDTSEKIDGAVKRSELGGSAVANVVKSLTAMDASAQNIQQVFTGIVGQVKLLDEVISQIATASQEQTSRLTKVKMAVGQMDKLSQSNAAGAQESANSSGVLNSQATNLQLAIRDLQGISNGRREDASSTTSPRARSLPFDRDNAKSGFGQKATIAKAKASAPYEFQNV